MRSVALRNNIIYCVIIFLLIHIRSILLQNIIILILLLISTLGTAFAFHYKYSLETFTMQRHINDKSTMKLVREISELTQEIRIVTYPGECDDITKEIIGDDCDLGNYMEWAGPYLEDETKQLLILLSD